MQLQAHPYPAIGPSFGAIAATLRRRGKAQAHKTHDPGDRVMIAGARFSVKFGGG